MLIKNITLLCLMLFGCISMPAWSLSTAAPEKVRLQLKWTHQFQFAGYYAAKEQGYYADAGLEVEFIERTTDTTAIKQVMSGKAQYGVSDSSIVVAFSKGTQIKALAAIFQHNPLVFFTKQSSGITNPFEMKGKHIMLEKYEAYAPLRACFLGAGLKDDDYISVEHTYDNGSLVRDEVDVISNYLTDAPYYFQQQDVKINIINPQDYGVDFYGDILFASRQETIDHPERAQRFKQATIKGWQYALTHQEELVQLIHEKYKSKLSLNALRYEAKEIAKLISADTIPLGTIEASRLLRAAEVYAQLYKIKALNIDDLRSFIQADEVAHRITLDHQEQSWLKEHSDLSFTGDPDWLPYEAFDEQGKYVGIVAEYLKLIEKHSGIKFNIIPTKTWQESVAKVRDGEIDIISEMVNSSLTDTMVFTKPYLSSPIIMVMNDKQAYVNNIEQIFDKKIALIKEYGYVKQITDTYPGLDYYWVDNLQQGLEAVSSGKAEVLLSTLTHASYAISNLAIQNIRIVGKTEFTSDLAFGVKKAYAPILIPLLNRAFDSITAQEKKQIFDKWGKVEFVSQANYRAAIQVSLGLLLLLSIVLYWNRTLRKQIAARKQAEAFLKVSEYRFSSLLAAVDSVSVQGYDAERKVIFWNKASEAIYGFTEQEALGKKLEDLIVPSDMRSGLIKAHGNWLESDIAIPSGELALIRKDGKLVDVFSSHVLQTNVDGEQEMFCIDVDLSERKQVENQLRESESRLQEAQQYAQIGYWELLCDGEKAIWSEQVRSILGLSQDAEASFKSLCSVMEHSYHADFFKSLEHSLATGDEQHIEYSIRRPDNGEQRWIESRGKKTLGNNGGIEKFSGFIQDITERKWAEESRQAALGKLQKIARLVPGAIYQYRLNIDGKCSFPFASEAIKEIYRVKPEEIREDAAKVFEVIHPDDLERVNASIQKSAEELALWQCEYRVKFDDGTVNWLLGNAMPEREKDGATLWHGFITDITHNKRREHVLRVLAESGTNHDDDIFKIMVKELAVSQGTRYALLAKITGNDFSYSETLAVWANGEIVDNFSYNLEGTPCKEALQDGQCFYPQDIQRLFPADHILVDMHAESYIGVPLKGHDGQILGLIALLDDKPMRENTQALELLKSLSARAGIELERRAYDKQLKLSSQVFNNTHEGITITNAQKEIVDVNPAFSVITGFSREEVIGKNPRILSSGKQSQKFYADMWQGINELGHWQGEVWNRRKDGELYAELLTISTLLDENGKIINYIGVFTDITQSKQQQEKLSLMAHYDLLTGLPNRALFTDRFHQAIAHSKRTVQQLAVCFLDLDNFKPVNDNYGHNVGDDLLIEVANRITGSIREEDTVSRQGGDEFALLLNDIESIGQCEITLERILCALAEPYLIDSIQHNITASIGVTLYPADNEDIGTLIRHADQAMYQAKQSGKHRYHVFDSKHDKQQVKKHHKLDEIQQGLINNEFQLYCQPKVNMVSGEVFGVEALIRWIHPEKGIISPLDFLPFTDGTNLELKIGDWVIHQALQQMDSWLVKGIKLEVSVNIASHHLMSKDFFVNLEAALAKYPTVNSQCLQLEILESSALSDLQLISRIIKTCQESLGVNIALDDFGTGYSSLTHLRSLTANTIKIDQSFVRDVLDDPDDFTIIDGVIGLAGSFNRKVIAEGIGTTEQGLMLLMMGCEEVQGYGISKPIPVDDFPAWLAAYIPNQEWLSYGSKVRTDKENKNKIFSLVIEHWRERFISKVQSSLKDKQQWPIMSGKHGPCGQWIKRARKEGLFEQESLNRLQSIHDDFHFNAQAIQASYQAGDIDKARDELEGLMVVYHKMKRAGELCE